MYNNLLNKILKNGFEGNEIYTNENIKKIKNILRTENNTPLTNKRFLNLVEDECNSSSNSDRLSITAIIISLITLVATIDIVLTVTYGVMLAIYIVYIIRLNDKNKTRNNKLNVIKLAMKEYLDGNMQ